MPSPAVGKVTFEEGNNLANWIDRQYLPGAKWDGIGGEKDKHYGKDGWDPEGLLSTFPAIATAMLGIFAGRWIAEKRRPLLDRIVGLYGVGCLAMVG